MEQIVISDDDDVSDEVVAVPPFVPTPSREEVTATEPTRTLELPSVEITFANLTKLPSPHEIRFVTLGPLCRESCRRIKEAFVRWAETQAPFRKATGMGQVCY